MIIELDMMHEKALKQPRRRKGNADRQRLRLFPGRESQESTHNAPVDCT